METVKCPQCGTELDLVDRIKFKPSWQGGSREVVKQAVPCRVCEERAQAQQQAIWRERQFRNWRFDSGIPENVWELGLEPATWRKHRLELDAGNGPAFEALRSWVAADNAGMLIMGTQGLGKSLLAMCAGMDCLRRGQEVLFVTERDLLDSFKGRRKAETDITMRAREVEVLILDDIGRHQIDRGTRYMLEVYLDIFDCRLPVLGPPLKTLMTTQHDPGSLARACADDALASRLMAIVGGNHIELSGRDRRRARWSIGDTTKGGA